MTYGASGANLSNIVATNNQTGLELGYLSSGTAPTLGALDLRDNGVGLLIVAMSIPAVIDGAPGMDFSGCGTAVKLTANTGLTLRNLTLPGTTYGIDGLGATNNNLTLQNLNVSGLGTGVGALVSGADISVSTVTASRRSTGLHISGARPVISTVTANDGGDGLRVTGDAGSTPTLSGLTLRNNYRGLFLESWSTAFTVDGMNSLANLDVTGSGLAFRGTFGGDGTLPDMEGIAKLSMSPEGRSIYAASAVLNKIFVIDCHRRGSR